MKLLKLFGMAFLVLLVVLLARTFMAGSKQLEVAAVAMEDFDSALLAEKLSAGIKIPTISSAESAGSGSKAFQQFRALFANQFPDMHRVLSLELVGDSMLFRWQGSHPDAKPILLMAHADVVPVQAETRERWSVDPFSGEIRDGYVWGRGALDDKGSLYLIAAAVDRLAAQGYQPKRDIWISFGHDEEVGGVQGNKRIAERFAQQGVTFEAVIDEGGTTVLGMMPGIEGPVSVIGIAEKGYLTLTLSVSGVGGHSSTPQSESTIAILGGAIARLEAEQFDLEISPPVSKMLDYLGPEMPFGQRLAMSNRWLFGPVLEHVFAAKDKTRAMLHTTIAPTMLRAGVQENVLAKQAEAVVNFRIAPGDTQQSIIEYVHAAIDDARVSVTANTGFAAEASPVSSTDSKTFHALQKSIQETYPTTVVSPYLMMAATDSRHFKDVAEDVYRFMPYVVDSDELDGIHGIDERIAVDTLARGTNFYWRLVQNLDAE